MFVSLSFLAAMETMIIFSNTRNCLNINIFTHVMREHCSKLDLQQLSHSMFCKNIARLAVAREHHLAVAMCNAP